MSATNAFYEAARHNALRLGDIVSGFTIGTVNLPKVLADEYSVDLERPRAAIMTPCCSIGERTILLSPLKKIHKRLLETPYLREDLTNLNRPMTRVQGFSPDRLKRLREDERIAIEADTRKVLGFVEIFVYAPHDLLPTYECKIGRTTVPVGHYMIDFREIHRIKCNEIQSAENSPLNSKLLQISRTSREQLRTKLANYFGRSAPEDEV